METTQKKKFAAKRQEKIFIPANKCWRHEGVLTHISEVADENLVKGIKALGETYHNTESKRAYALQRITNATEELERRGKEDLIPSLLQEELERNENANINAVKYFITQLTESELISAIALCEKQLAKIKPINEPLVG